MWLTRTNSKIRVPSNNTFSCSSFKDIQTLIADDSGCRNPTQFAKHYIFHRVRLANAFLRALSPPQPAENKSNNATCQSQSQSHAPISLPGAEKRIVVYFTSLRVVRRTFEDCRDVLSVLRSFRVSIDERDLSADAGFREELQGILGVRERTKLTLPQVFIGGRHIGGAEEIRRLHESGELKKCVEGLPPANPDTCELCDGHRYILCDECDVSHGEKCGFRTCTACSQSGLINCPSCSRAPI